LSHRRDRHPIPDALAGSDRPGEAHLFDSVVEAMHPLQAEGFLDLAPRRVLQSRR
jgi:predicted NAD/FAD-binding protein